MKRQITENTGFFGNSNHLFKLKKCRTLVKKFHILHGLLILFYHGEINNAATQKYKCNLQSNVL